MRHIITKGDTALSGLHMLNDQRAFIDAIKTYCLARNISVDLLAGGWIVQMDRGSELYFSYGYDLGLNSSVAYRIANDKAATAEILELHGINCVPHVLFLAPKLAKYVATSGSWAKMLGLLKQYPSGLVVKPNEGTSGYLVCKASTNIELERAVNTILSSDLNVAVSPYYNIEEEVRVVLVDLKPVVVYRKQRHSVIGDGVRSVLELALSTLSTIQLADIFLSGIGDFNRGMLDEIVPIGQSRFLNWRHNLELGSAPVLLEQGEVRERCVALGIQAAQAIGIRFCSVDVVKVNRSWLVLEINSGVMMETLNKTHPDVVHAAYESALDALFKTHGRLV